MNKVVPRPLSFAMSFSERFFFNELFGGFFINHGIRNVQKKVLTVFDLSPPLKESPSVFELSREHHKK